MSPQVSVVVPVWNAEAYLARCVDSILGQTLTDIEVVLVDDGSTDASGAMIDDYAARDPRVKAIHTDNRGPADARHTGVHASAGEYVVMYDNDDYAPFDALERLYVQAQETKADLVIGDYWISPFHGSPDFIRVRHPELNGAGPLCFLKRWLNGEIRGAMWTMLLRRELFTGNIREYLPGFGEDNVMIVQLLARTKSPVQLDGEPVYYHLLRERSLAAHELPWSAKKVGEHAQSTRFILDYVEQHVPEREAIADELAYYALYHLSLLMTQDKGRGNDFSDLETRIYRDYFPHCTARRRLRKLWPKQYVFLMAERRAGWRLVRKVLWGTPLMRKAVRTLYQTVRKFK